MLNEFTLDMVFMVLLILASAWIFLDTGRACRWIAWGQDATPPRLVPFLRVVAGITFGVACVELIRALV